MNQDNTDSDIQKPWALVTGASAGIGTEFCRQLATQGYQLVLVARRADRLQAVADELRQSFGAHSIIITADLSQKDACETVVNRLEKDNISIEYLVNNAGYGLPGSFHVPDWQEHADFIQVMMTTVCELTWRLLPAMRERGRGFVVNVASVAGLVSPSAGHTLYGASKSFLIKFSQSLAMENEQSGVKVCALCPGFTYSEFHDVNGTREMISQLPSYLWLDAKDVVADTLEAMSKEKVKTVVVPGRQYKFIVFVYRYLPWLASILSKRSAKHYRVTE
ncbi:SDR family NAD(P)-dependent oxidoreductase [Pseudomonadota bacterium]